MGFTFNVIAICFLLYMSFLNYRNYSRSLKASGEVLETIRVGGKSFIVAGIVLVVLYPMMVFSQGIAYNEETITSIIVLVVVLFSFIVTYQTSSLYFTQYGLIIKGLLFEYHKIKQYQIIDDPKKPAITFTIKDHKDREVNYRFKLTQTEKINVEKVMDSYFRKNKSKKKSKKTNKK